MMRGHTLFSRLLTVSLAVILACVGVLSALSYMYLRDNAIQSRMRALKTQARDMAYLASRLTSDSFYQSLGKTSATEGYMRWKSRRIYQEYNAYIMVVDRYGKVSLYYSEDTLQDESIKAMPGTEDLAAFMELALKGEEVVRETKSAAGPLFTVLVPWVQENSYTNTRTVMGFVLIQTAAQTVRAAYSGLIWQTVLAALGIFLLAAVALFFITRQMTRPLTAMAGAASSMARGDFSARASEKGSGEIRRLAETFNSMSEKIETLDITRNQFVANASHELKTPLAAMKVLIESLVYQPDMDKGLRTEFLQDINREIDRLSAIVSDLLTLVRMDAGSVKLAREKLTLQDLVEENRHRLDPMARKRRQELVINIKDPCEMSADKGKMNQVIYNLMENAIKYTQEGGRIVVTLDRTTRNAVLSVKDNGPGIPQDAIPHIFDRFFRVDKARSRETGGTGLGLSIVRQMVLLHGGTIRVESQEGHGSDFIVELPVGGQG